MSDILSQNEIDELLNALSAGELNVSELQQKEQEKKVRLYDFSRPNKFAKEHMRTLNIIYENFSRLFSSFLSGILRSFCQVDVVSIEEQTYYEFNNSLPDPVILAIIGFYPLHGPTLLEVSPTVAYGIIDRLLGGPGRSSDQKRNFTEIELVLVERILRQILDFLRDSWSNVLSVEPVLERIETNSQFAQIVSPNETIAIITLSVKIGDIDGMLNFCIPHVVIEPIVKKLNTKYWFSSKTETQNNKGRIKDIKHKLDTSALELRAILGETTISVRDVLNLQQGDVIQLEQKASENVSIKIGPIIKFHGILGVRKKRLAVRITSVMEEEVVENE